VVVVVCLFNMRYVYSCVGRLKSAVTGGVSAMTKSAVASTFIRKDGTSISSSAMSSGVSSVSNSLRRAGSSVIAFADPVARKAGTQTSSLEEINLHFEGSDDW
jgi:hypothetical protein